MFLRLVLTLIIIGNAQVVLAGIVQDPDMPWCIERDASSDKKQLNCLKSESVSRTLKKNFDEILEQQKKCPKCKIPIINGNQYLSMYHLPFLVMAITFLPHDPGYELHVIFMEKPLRELTAWMFYDADHDTYKLGLMGGAEQNKKTTRLIKKLRGKEFKQFWFR